MGGLVVFGVERENGELVNCGVQMGPLICQGGNVERT